jgi:hypothetical protein
MWILVRYDTADESPCSKKRTHLRSGPSCRKPPVGVWSINLGKLHSLRVGLDSRIQCKNDRNHWVKSVRMESFFPQGQHLKGVLAEDDES